MSYLDPPRIHFAGLFFAGPSTINNLTTNYDPSVKLERPPGHYLPGVAGWNAMGVAQFYLQQCTVLGAVDSSGRWLGAGDDPLIGVPIETPNPLTAINDNGDVFDIAKLVDLDPDQQGRTELYGMRFALRLPNGTTFGGPMTIPQLRELGPRIPIQGGSFTAVGVFMGSIDQPTWPSGASGSAVLDQLQHSSGQGIAVQLTVDLHWNNPNTSKDGLQFCYGRVHGTMGPLRGGERGQTLYGRRMASSDVPKPARPDPTPRATVAAFTASQALAAPSMPAWNASYAAVETTASQTRLTVDLGMAIPLLVDKNAPPPGVDGTPIVESGITVGVVDGTGSLVPLSNGAVSFAPYAYSLESAAKNCVCWRNCGVFSIALSTNELETLGSGALAVAVNGRVVMQEASSGIWVQCAEMAGRVPLPGATLSIPVLVTQRGEPLGGYAPAAFQVLVSEWVQQSGEWTNQTVPSADLSAAFEPASVDASGVTTLNVRSTVPQMTLSQLRADLDSGVYFLQPPQDDTVSVADDQVPLSLLVWQPFTAPPSPTWDSDIAPILGAYARLYPGMKAKVDIGAQKAAQANALGIADRMALSIADPAYMPVTRDLSPAKTQMIVAFMNAWARAPDGTTR